MYIYTFYFHCWAIKFWKDFILCYGPNTAARSVWFLWRLIDNCTMTFPESFASRHGLASAPHSLRDRCLLIFCNCTMTFPESFASRHGLASAPHSLRDRCLLIFCNCTMTFPEASASRHGLASAPRSVRQGYHRIILFKEVFEKSSPASKKQHKLTTRYDVLREFCFTPWS
jgi:hypothetical protein